MLLRGKSIIKFTMGIDMGDNEAYRNAPKLKKSDEKSPDSRLDEYESPKNIAGKKQVYIERPGIIIRKGTDMSQGPYTRRYMGRK